MAVKPDAVLNNKFDFSKLKDDLTKTFKGSNLTSKFGLGSDLKVLKEEDFIKLPEWWSKATGLFGIPFGRVTLIAGGSDTGKTSLCIQTMKAAQNQGVGIIFTDTEKKTTKADFECWGVDPEQVFLNKTCVAEEAFQLTLESAESFIKNYPNAPLLIIIDSLGNMLSQRDSELDLINESQKPGGKGSIVRLGLNRLVAMSETHPKVAILLVSYTYDNLGSVGKTNAGGTALHYFSSLIYQTSRKAWYERTENGIKIRAGADVIYSLYKNHLNKENPGSKKIVYRITKDGFQLLESSNEE